MTVTARCKCGCDHIVNSDMKDLLNSTRKCFMCGEQVSFRVKEVVEAAVETSEGAEPEKKKGQPAVGEKKRRGRPRKNK